MKNIAARPRLLGLLCGAGAVVLGMGYLVAAGAPPHYPLVNLAALVIGAAAWLALERASRPMPTGAAVFVLALLLMLTALFGVEVEGASRWVSVGPLTLHVGLIVLPAMIVLYARRVDALGTIGMALAALAVAAQPDRAMAAALLAGVSMVVLTERARLPAMAALAAAAGFGWTVFAPDRVPPMPYVEGILQAAFDVHPLAGVAVVVGAGALVLPGLVGIGNGSGERSPSLAFAVCWLAVLIAAALGDYPTPVVGYGGAAVLGYLSSVAVLPETRRPRKN